MSELALFREEVPHYGINKFQLVTSYCRSGFRGGGIGIFVSEKYFTECIPIDISTFCVENILEAGAVVIKGRKNNFVVVSVYRPPSDLKTNVDLFIDQLTEVLEFVSAIKKDIILIGDLNICTLSESYKRTQLNECIKLFNLCSVISAPTRVTAVSASAIDSIFTNILENKYQSGTLVTALTDHDGIFIKILNNVKEELKDATYQYAMSDEAISAFKYFLADNDWCNVLECEDAQKGYTIFHNTLLTCFRLSFPVKKIHYTKKNNTPYLSDSDLHKLKTEIIKLSERLKADGNPQSREELNKFKEKYHSRLNENKRKYYDQVIAGSSNKIKSAWQIINAETRRCKLGQRKVNVKNNQGSIADYDEACSLFNEHFLSVPIQVLSGLSKFKSSHGEDLNEANIRETIFLSPVDEFEITKIIASLKNKNSYGIDLISNNLLKKIAHLIVQPLVHLVNLSLAQGIFPVELKVAKVTPIYKKGDAHCVKNYRPVSVLTSISKVFELAILKRLSCFFTKYQILSKNQFGFLKGKSAVDAVIALVERIIDEMEAGKSSASTFLDLTAAFDCVDHRLLLRKLSECGVRGNSNKLLHSYLTNRQQFVCFESTPTKLRKKISTCPAGFYGSDLAEIQNGVPQGSILGPFLFLVYVNSLVKDNFLYADDTTCLVSAENVSDLEISMFQKVNLLTQDLAELNLGVNPTKTAVIFYHLGRKEIKYEPVVFLDDELLENESSVKFLGMHIDKKLSWSSHVDVISSKICSGLFVLRNIVGMCSIETALSVYYALIESHISYGIALWGSGNIANMEKIFKLQKRAMRYMCDLTFGASCREHYKTLKILTVPSIYIKQICLLVKKQSYSFTKIGDRHTYCTRHGNTLEFPCHRTSRYESKPAYRGILLFNKLPPEIKQIKSTYLFQKKLKDFLINKCYYSLGEYLG